MLLRSVSLAVALSTEDGYGALVKAIFSRVRYPRARDACFSCGGDSGRVALLQINQAVLIEYKKARLESAWLSIIVGALRSFARLTLLDRLLERGGDSSANRDRYPVPFVIDGGQP